MACIQASLTLEEKARILDALVSDVTISAANEITITGTLAPSVFENNRAGSPAAMNLERVSGLVWMANTVLRPDAASSTVANDDGHQAGVSLPAR